MSVIKNRKTGQPSKILLLEDELSKPGICGKCKNFCGGLRPTVHTITGNVRSLCEYHYGKAENIWCDTCEDLHGNKKE